MALRRRTNLRRTASHHSVQDTVVRDMASLIRRDGSDVTFMWTEYVGGTWNEVYEIWEGGTEEYNEIVTKGLGRVVDYKEGVAEYEWGRIEVGEALIRFPIDLDLEHLKDKEGLRIMFKGQKWRIGSPLGVCEYYGNEPYCKVLKGVKAVD